MELNDFNLSKHLNEQDYSLIEDNVRHKSFKKGDYITVPGQVQRELYFVKKGVQMSFFDTDKHTHVIAFSYPPDPCAVPDSFSLQIPSKYFLKCLTDSEMNYLTYDQLQELFDESRAIERVFGRITATILAGMMTRHIELHAYTIEERFKSFCQRSPHLLQLVPHKYIASYLGIDPTNFSKLFNSVKI